MKQRVFNLYVAGSSAKTEALRVRTAMDLVLEHPRMRLTLDWQKNIERSGLPANVGLPYDHRIRVATEALDAVRRADIFWLLAPSVVTRGGWVELGVALEQKKVIVISGADSGNSIFCALGQEIATDEDAFAVICALLKEYPWDEQR